jgi:hypothetical protein
MGRIHPSPRRRTMTMEGGGIKCDREIPYHDGPARAVYFPYILFQAQLQASFSGMRGKTPTLVGGNL